MSALLLLAVPVALWGAWRLLRVVGRLVDPGGAPALAGGCWGAVTYALVPVTSGAWGDGRLGVVVAAALLPWVAHAALGFADPERDRRWRAAWRTGLLLALGAAFVPVAWVFAVLLTAVCSRRSPWPSRAAAARPRQLGAARWSPSAVTPVLLAPWWLPVLGTAPDRLLLMEAGGCPAPPLGFTGLLTRPAQSDLGAPVVARRSCSSCWPCSH